MSNTVRPFMARVGGGVLLSCSTTSASTTIPSTNLNAQGLRSGTTQTFVLSNKSAVWIHVRIESLIPITGTPTAATTAEYACPPTSATAVSAPPQQSLGNYTVTAIADSGSGNVLHIMPGSYL